MACTFALAIVTSEVTVFNPAFGPLLTSPAVGGGIVALWLMVQVALILLARQTTNLRDRALILAILSTGAVATVFQGLAPAAGWWDGYAFRLPIVVQACLYGAKLEGGVALFLLGFRWLVSRSHRLALALWAVLMLLQIPAAYQGDALALAAGAFVFQNAYTVAWDSVYGLILMGLPIGVYELLTAAPLRRLGRTAAASHEQEVWV